jgi:hypothetical protein
MYYFFGKIGKNRRNRSIYKIDRCLIFLIFPIILIGKVYIYVYRCEFVCPMCGSFYTVHVVREPGKIAREWKELHRD